MGSAGPINALNDWFWPGLVPLNEWLMSVASSGPGWTTDPAPHDLPKLITKLAEGIPLSYDALGGRPHA